jgi:hypothetical protein
MEINPGRSSSHLLNSLNLNSVEELHSWSGENSLKSLYYTGGDIIAILTVLIVITAKHYLLYYLGKIRMDICIENLL